MYGVSWCSQSKAETVFWLGLAAVASSNLDFEVHRSQGDVSQGVCTNGIKTSHLDDFGEKLLGVKKPEDFKGFAGVIVSQKLLLHFGCWLLV